MSSAVHLTLTPEQRDLLQLGLLVLSSAVDRNELGRLADRWPTGSKGQFPSVSQRHAQLEALSALLRDPQPVTLVVEANGHPVPPMTGSAEIEVITVRTREGAPAPSGGRRRTTVTATRGRVSANARVVERARRQLVHDVDA